MAHTIKRTKRELSVYLEPMGFVYEGMTRNMHLRWRHQESGAMLVTVSDMGNRRNLNNVLCDARNVIRRSDCSK
jgi:hypothetical protein